VPLLTPDECEVVLVCSDRDVKRARYLLHRAERYLHLHEIDPVQSCATETPIREALEEELPGKPDVFVLGVHDRHGLRDFLPGSLTRHLLRRADTALFLGQ